MYLSSSSPAPSQSGIGATNPPSSSGAKSYPTGTIAALALAGILAFLILTVLLVFTFVYRPRQRRRKQLEAGTYGPADGSKDIDHLATAAATTPARRSRSSRWTGFARWKREVEVGNGNLGGITFRDADGDKSSPQRRPGQPSQQSLSLKSSISSWRWRERARRQQASENSFTVSLPPRNIHPFSRTSSANSEATQDPKVHSDEEPAEGSLQYTSTPSTGIQPLNQSAIPSSNRAHTAYPNSPVTQEANHPFPNASTDGNKGKQACRDSMDHMAVRGLSPQLSSSYARDIARRSGSPIITSKPRGKLGNRHQDQPPSGEPQDGPSRLSPTYPPDQISQRYLNLRLDGTPFELAFDNPNQSKVPSASQARPISDGSRVRFEDEDHESVKAPQYLPTAGPLLPPPSAPTLPSQPKHVVESSFLDLDANSSKSRPSHSSGSSSVPSSWQVPAPRNPRSRWSSTTGQQTHEGDTSSSSGYGSLLLSNKPSLGSLQPPPSEHSSFFPFPVSQPPTPYHSDQFASQQDRQPQSTSLGGASRRGSSGFSDGDSVPRSISDLEFQHSDSDRGDSHRASMQLPVHPPLPGTPSASSFIVARVLGQEQSPPHRRSPNFE